MQYQEPYITSQDVNMQYQEPYITSQEPYITSQNMQYQDQHVSFQQPYIQSYEPTMYHQEVNMQYQEPYSQSPESTLHHQQVDVQYQEPYIQSHDHESQIPQPYNECDLMALYDNNNSYLNIPKNKHDLINKSLNCNIENYEINQVEQTIPDLTFMPFAK
jgi:hypothetical protein